MIDPIEINSWKHFTDIVDALDNSSALNTPYAYRGQSNEKWGLVPSLLRHMIGKEITELDALNIEKSALEEFKSQAHIYLSTNELSSISDMLSWWSVMQHHGAPTRLLDWSASIYVAAYFAVTESLDKDGAVWVLHLHESNQRMSTTYGDLAFPSNDNDIKENLLKEGAPHHVVFLGRKSKSPRMVSQQGYFSVCRSVTGNHGEVFDTLFPEQEPKEYYRKLIVPSQLKRECN